MTQYILRNLQSPLILKSKEEDDEDIMPRMSLSAGKAPAPFRGRGKRGLRKGQGLGGGAMPGRVRQKTPLGSFLLTPPPQLIVFGKLIKIIQQKDLNTNQKLKKKT